MCDVELRDFYSGGIVKGNPEVENDLEDLGVYGRIILKLILN